MTVFWTRFAKNRLRAIFEFYRDKAELSIAQRLFEGIVNHTHDLPAHPLKGQIEPLLADRTQEFRYLVFKNY